MTYVLGRDNKLKRLGLESSKWLSRPFGAEGEKQIMRGIVQMIHEGFVWLACTVLVLLMVVLLPAAALLTRALIPVTAATIVVLFVASCVSSRMRAWLYS